MKFWKLMIGVVAGAILFFSGWIIKDQPYGKEIGRAMMSLGLITWGVIIIKYVWKNL